MVSTKVQIKDMLIYMQKLNDAAQKEQGKDMNELFKGIAEFKKVLNKTLEQYK